MRSKNFLGVGFFIFLISINSIVYAEEKIHFAFTDARWLFIDKNDIFLVEIYDNVGDGCFTDPNLLKNAVMIELKRSGYKIGSDRAKADYVIDLQATGYELSNTSCVTSYTLEVSAETQEYGKYEGKNIRTVYRSVLWSRGGLMSGPKSRNNQRLKEIYTREIQKFLLAIDEKKLEVINDFISAGDYLEDKAQKEFWENEKAKY